VQGRRLVGRLNVDGDAQGDLHGHGGEHRAVFVYQMDSYRYWERELKRSDFTFGQFGTEIFGSGKPITPGVKQMPRRPPHAPAGSPGKGPRISFARAGLTVSWDPRFQSLLELAEACDVPARWACRTGVCHTCECGLVSGSVTYDPEPLEPPADGNLLTCCSRPRHDLVIDI
jgi:ferredoxin